MTQCNAKLDQLKSGIKNDIEVTLISCINCY